MLQSETINKPIFFYHSTDDEIVRFSHLSLYKEKFPHAAIRKIIGGGHQLNNDLSEVNEKLLIENQKLRTENDKLRVENLKLRINYKEVKGLFPQIESILDKLLNKQNLQTYTFKTFIIIWNRIIIRCRFNRINRNPRSKS